MGRIAARILGEREGRKELAEYLLNNFKLSSPLQQFLLKIKKGASIEEVEKEIKELTAEKKGKSVEEKIKEKLFYYTKALSEDEKNKLIHRIKKAKELKITEKANLIVSMLGDSKKEGFESRDLEIEDHLYPTIKWRKEPVYIDDWGQIKLFVKEEMWLETLNAYYQTAKRRLGEMMGIDFSKEQETNC